VGLQSAPIGPTHSPVSGEACDQVMHNDFEQMVHLARQVSASGRWETLNEKVRALAHAPGLRPHWWIQVMGGLLSKVFTEYLSLKQSFDDKGEPSLLAWRARNLLELSIWSQYCSKTEEHAHRVYEDAGRDEIGIYEEFSKWGTATSKDQDFLDIFSEASKNLEQRAMKEGISSLDGKFKEVADAAKELGLWHHYKVSNRMLSKFAHPTALSILAVADQKTEQEQRELFFAFGCLFFVGAFNMIELQLT